MSRLSSADRQRIYQQIRDGIRSGRVLLLCNRCNARKPDEYPCPKCGCPEYRIEGLTDEEKQA